MWRIITFVCNVPSLRVVSWRAKRLSGSTNGSLYISRFVAVEQLLVDGTPCNVKRCIRHGDEGSSRLVSVDTLLPNPER